MKKYDPFEDEDMIDAFCEDVLEDLIWEAKVKYVQANEHEFLEFADAIRAETYEYDEWEDIGD